MIAFIVLLSKDFSFILYQTKKYSIMNEYQNQMLTVLHRFPQPNTHKPFTKVYPSTHFVQTSFELRQLQMTFYCAQFSSWTCSDEWSLYTMAVKFRLSWTIFTENSLPNTKSLAWTDWTSYVPRTGSVACLTIRAMTFWEELSFVSIVIKFDVKS